MGIRKFMKRHDAKDAKARKNAEDARNDRARSQGYGTTAATDLNAIERKNGRRGDRFIGR